MCTDAETRNDLLAARRPRRTTYWILAAVLGVLASACQSTPEATTPGPETATLGSATPAPAVQPAAVCGNQPLGPEAPPPGAVVVNPDITGDLSAKTEAKPARTTFWLAPGVHRLLDDEFSQVVPKAGNVYIGAPGAVFDGRGINRYAFTQYAENVTIRSLTIKGSTHPTTRVW